LRATKAEFARAAAHQATITATFKDNANAPLAGRTITFSLVDSHAEYPASLSVASAVTGPTGIATTVLTSSRKIGANAVVKATVDEKEAQIGVGMQDATEVWDIQPQELDADGTSQAQVKLTLMFGTEKVDGHQTTWRINQIADTDDSEVYTAEPAFGSLAGYGSLSESSTATDENGLTQTTYTVGTEGGTIAFAAVDSTVVANSPRVRVTASKLALNRFYVYTYIARPDLLVPLPAAVSAASAGTPSGVRGTKKFGVTLSALFRRKTSVGRPSESLIFRPKRFATNATDEIAGNLPAAPGGGIVSGPNTIWTYWSGDSAWDITKLRGKWQISVKWANGTVPVQTTATFKIDKRDQIVQLAREWRGVKGTVAEPGPSDFYCGDFTAMIYNHLNVIRIPYVTTPDTTGDQFSAADYNDSGNGALVFYSNQKPPLAAGSFAPGHVAIRDGENRINVNSNTQKDALTAAHKEFADMIIESEPLNAGFGDGSGATAPYYSIEGRATIPLDAD